jgi:hypothetical protein
MKSTNYAYTHEIFDGWAGTGLWDDDNRRLAALRTDFAATYPGMADVAREILAMYRDGMVALLEGVAAAPIMTPAGVC